MKNIWKMRPADDDMDFDELDDRTSEQFLSLTEEEVNTRDAIAEKAIPEDPYKLKKRYFADTPLEELNEKYGENGKYVIDEKMQVLLQDMHDWLICLKDEALMYEVLENLEEEEEEE